MPQKHKDIPIKFAPVFDGLSGISHGFFGRKGGVSTGKYSSLNTGRGSDDNPEHVEENRRRVAQAIGTTRDRLLSNHQIHSRKVIIVEKPWQAGAQPKADGMVTKVSGIALSALSADCSPVLFADQHAGVIGAAHAGWRGALAGVTDATIDKMVEIGAKREKIIAAIGPCIGSKHFEVGPEFVSEFITDSLGNGTLFTPGEGDRSYFDIKTYLVRRLLKAGIGQATALSECTYDSPDTYFSYRYNCHNGIEDYGRNISVIMLNL